MFKKLVDVCNNLVNKYLPDAYIFAVLITILIMILGAILTGQGPLTMIDHWGDGFWSLIPFTMQITMLIVTGFILGDTPIIKKFLNKIASVPKTPRSAIFFITFVSFFAFYINSGIALIVGPILAKAIAKNVKGVDYRLLVASGYVNAMSLQGGLTGAIALKLASGGESLSVESGGMLTTAIPMTDTVFTWWNILLQVLLLLILPTVNMFMHPSPDKVVTISPELLEEDEVEEEAIDKSKLTPAERMENSPILNYCIGAIGLIYVIQSIISGGIAKTFEFNTINLLCMFLAIILHKTPKKFLDSTLRSARSAIGILIQFPFYAGVMGMMVGANSAGVTVAGILSNAFVSISTTATFPVILFLSAGLINFLIPSGGGHWAVLGPIMMPAGMALGLNPALIAMIIAYGGAWTDGIQPFWALPSLGIAKLGVRDIMGFCVVDVLIAGVIMVGVFTFAAVVM